MAEKNRYKGERVKREKIMVEVVAVGKTGWWEGRRGEEKAV